VFVIGDDIELLPNADQAAGGTQIGVAARAGDRVDAQITKTMDGEHANDLRQR
jgi:hypothetical protein